MTKPKTFGKIRVIKQPNKTTPSKYDHVMEMECHKVNVDYCRQCNNVYCRFRHTSTILRGKERVETKTGRLDVIDVVDDVLKFDSINGLEPPFTFTDPYHIIALARYFIRKSKGAK